MATVPTYVYIGDSQINGGDNPTNRAWTEGAIFTGLSGLWGVYRNYPLFSQTVPSDPTTGLAPGSPAYAPYWDGAYNSGAGAWVVYHHSRSKNTTSAGTGVVSGAMGDNWYEFGGGVTPTTMLMQLLKERHSTAPYFKFFKQAINGGIGSGAGPLATTGWAAITAEFDAAAAAATGDTLDVQVVILDASATDIAASNLSYATDLQTVITRIRTKWPTCMILLVNHHRGMLSGSLPPVSAFARGVNKAVAAANTDVVLFDMSWASWAPDSVGTYAAESTDPYFYDTESYLQAGARMFNTIEAWRTDAPAAVPGSGIAVVAMVTDSQGKTIDPNYAIYGDQRSILGAVGGTVRAGQYVWNGQTRQVELYDAVANSCTCPVVSPDSGEMGPEATMLKRLFDTYPDGVVVFKYSKNGAALTSEAVTDGATGAYESDAADLYDDLVSNWNDFRSAVMRDLNRTPDCIGAVFIVGDNDTLSTTASTSYAATLPTFVDDMREVFTTRSSGPLLPLVFMQPPRHLTDDVEPQSSHGILAARSAVRSAVAALATSQTRVTVIESDADLFELKRTDTIHYGGEATYAIGYDFADALVALGDDEGGTTTSSDSTASGAAAFTVETGSGSTSANSYCSVADADAYHLTQGNPTAWSTATTVEKQDALRQATTYLDTKYGSRWLGLRYSSEQALDWPRSYVTDSAGNDIETDTIPTRLVRACAVAALLHVQGETLLATTRTTGDVTSEASAVGAISRSVTYRGGKSPETSFPIIDRMLATAGLIESGGGWGAIRL